MRSLPVVAIGLTALASTLAGPAAAHHPSPGSLVGVSVEVDGRGTPLYPAPDGSGRLYLEAREGARYAITLRNRTAERLGVVLAVDGLNVVSGDRCPDFSQQPWARPGRMYVLDPRDATTVRGWRTSLQEVRRFTFVDERTSYAARAGKANRKMGWIELAVYREDRPYVSGFRDRVDGRFRNESEGRSEDGAARPAPMEPPPPAAAGSPSGDAARAPRSRAEAEELTKSLGGDLGPEARSYPGTGWGPRASDPVVVVQFEPAHRPAEILSLRYEYAEALVALGVLPRPRLGRDRLRERDGAEGGFVPPPAW